jgi:hypothetical protein
MATKDEDVKADIKKLGGTLAAHKGWFTREYRTLKSSTGRTARSGPSIF